MFIKKRKELRSIGIGFTCLILLSSCVNTSKSVYLLNQQDTTVESSALNVESVIQKNDLLNIAVSSLNTAGSAIFNPPNLPYAASSTGTTIQTTGYLVNQAGNIQFPVLGNIKAEGLTTEQLRDQIVKSLVSKELLVDPIVNVKYLSFEVTVLGEVGHPTVINVPNEKIALLKAIGIAGDITVFGRKDNVLLIREEGKKKQIRRIDLNSDKFLNSPYYYLKSNDIVYVEANKSKLGSTNRSMQLLPIILSGLSFVAIIITSIND
jgi:polysaccharide export outer membrane protein